MLLYVRVWYAVVSVVFVYVSVCYRVLVCVSVCVSVLLCCYGGVLLCVIVC